MDYGHEYADAQLEKLEKRLAKEYRQAFKTSRDMAREYFEQFDKEDKKMLDKLNTGQITEKEYLKWRQIEMATGERYNNMRDALAMEYNNVNKIAASMINDDVKDAFAENFNYGTYEIETGARVNTNFTIYNKDAVEAIVKDEPDLLPKAKVDIPKDLRWNKSKINSAIVQGILTGQSVDKIADNLQSVTNMNRNSAIRNARTMNNSARNLGRQKSYERGMAMGIKSKKMWLATPDGRTRHSHRIADNEVVEVTEKFSNGLMYPSDDDGPDEEVYNCRCRMINIPDGVDPKLFQEDKISDYMTGNNLTYEEWKHEREPKPKPATSGTKVVNGSDISATWIRRPDKFDFEIEDVMNAQGFDGKPRVVSANEFDELVKQANGGKGFIAQRTYSAPNQETLDAYRDQLYNGKWYVDCSTGGAQYGQGMYAAADYTGTLNDGIRREMNHYQRLNDNRIGVPASFDERMAYAKKTLKSEGLYSEDAASFVEEYLKNGSVDFDKYPKLSMMQKMDINDVASHVPTRFAPSYTETLTLDPSAKIIDYDDLFKRKANWMNEKRDEFKESAIKEALKNAGLENDESAFTFLKFQTQTGNVSWDDASIAHKALGDNVSTVNELVNIIKQKESDFDIAKVGNVNDIGSFAAMLGYDAINAEGHGESGSYTVILNRTKVIFKGE